MSQPLYHRILVLLDGTHAGERSLQWVRELTRGGGSVVHLLLVSPPGRALREGPRVVAFVDQIEDAQRHAALMYLDRVASGLRDDGLEVETHARTGSPLEIAWATAEALGADLAVLGVTDMAADVLRAAPLPVLVAGPGCLRSA